MDKIKKLRKIQEEIQNKEDLINSTIKCEMDKLKGRYFKIEEKDEDSPVKISIVHILETNWENCWEYERCYYCCNNESSDGEINFWYELDKEMSFSREIYELETALEMKEITKEEYFKSRDVIIEKVRMSEIDKIKTKFDELEKQGGKK